MKRYTDKKRLRGHLLTILEKAERSLSSFTSGASKGREIEHFDRTEEREWINFHMQVVLMADKLKKKLCDIFSRRKLSAQEVARLPDSVRRELLPTEEERLQDKNDTMMAKVWSNKAI